MYVYWHVFPFLSHSHFLSSASNTTVMVYYISPFPYTKLKCCITFKREIMKTYDAVLPAWTDFLLARTKFHCWMVGQVTRRRWRLRNILPLRGLFTTHAWFLLHSTVIERRLDRDDCFRHQTSQSQSIRVA
jgi:hypothetical protein